MLATEQEDKHVVITTLTFVIALVWLVTFIVEITGGKPNVPGIDAAMLAVLAYWFGTAFKPPKGN